MLRIILYVLLAAVMMNFLSCEDMVVKNLVNCTTIGRDRYYCIDVNITIGRIFEKFVDLFCAKSFNSTSMLPSLELGDMEKITLSDCLPASVTVRGIMDRLVIDSVDNVVVRGKIKALERGQLANMTGVVEVNLIGLGLTGVDPEGFGDNMDSSIESINMSDNNITELDVRTFYQLQRLWKLVLTSNKISTLPDDFFLFNRNIRYLGVAGNRINYIRSFFGTNDSTHESYLEFLDLRSNNIEVIEERAFYKFKNLQRLFLSENQLQTVPYDLIRYNHKIKLVNLEYNQIDHIISLCGAENTAYESDLEELDLSENNISMLGNRVFYKFKKLQTLILSNNKLRTLPQDLFRHNQRLRRLLLDYNQLENITSLFGTDDSIFENDLEDLMLIHNNISLLGDMVFDRLIKLEGLHLSYNQLKTLPYDLVRHNRKLTNLYLDNNQLENITSLFGNESMEYDNDLMNLDLSMNKINVLGDKVFYKLKKISWLKLSYNQLKTLPHDLFRHNQRLEYLYLDNNNLDNITSLFGADHDWAYYSIVRLDLSKNNIKYLDVMMFLRLKQLTYLDISYNKLVALTNYFPIKLRKDKEPDTNTDRPNQVKSHVQLRSVKLDFSHGYSTGSYWGEETCRLETVKISNNKLFDLQSILGVLQKCFNLRELDLSHNNISQLGYYWPYIKNLKSLDMSNNKITIFQTTELPHTATSFTLNLEENYISTVFIKSHETEISKQSVPIITVNLGKNPLVCDCHLHHFVKEIQGSNTIYLTEERLEFQQTEELVCGGPPAMRHRSIISLTLEELACPLHEGCPPPCFCYYRPEGLYTVVNCTAVGLKELPQSFPVHPDSRQTWLIMAHNQLDHIIYSSDLWPNVTDLDLSNTNLTTFNISNGTGPLKNLDLSHNQLTSLTDQTVNNLQFLDSLSIKDNPWRCWCEDLQLVRLIVKRSKTHINEMVNTTCHQDMRLIMDLEDTQICPISIPTDLLLPFCIVSAMAIVFFGFNIGQRYWNEILVVLYNSNNRWLRLLVSHPDDINQHLPYDAFISFTHEDDHFVSEHLLPQLLGRYKLCLHFRDWMPGEMIGRNVIRSILTSRRTIVVMSPNYLRSTWGSFEFEIAYMEGFRNIVNRMVVIMLDDIDNIPVRESVKLYMRTVTYLKWDNTANFWKRLHYSMPHPPEDSRLITCNVGGCCQRQRSDEELTDHEEGPGLQLAPVNQQPQEYVTTSTRASRGSSRICCLLRCCCKHPQEVVLNHEQLIKEMLQILPLPLALQDQDSLPSDHKEEEIINQEELLSSLTRLRNVVSMFQTTHGLATYNAGNENSSDLKELLEQMRNLSTRVLELRMPGPSTEKDGTTIDSSSL